MTEQMKKNKKNKKYILCTAGVVLLFCFALCIPQLVFRIQDYYQMNNTEVAVREAIDVALMNSNYELNLHDRLHNFLQMKTEVTAVDYEFADDAELQSFIDELFEQEWFHPIYDNWKVSFNIYSKEIVPAVKDCKKYVFYGSDVQNGIALMVWYLDLYFDGIDTRVRFLVDTETKIIYYMKVTAENEWEYDAESVVGTNYYYAAMISQCYEFYGTYYEAEIEDLIYYETDKNGDFPWYRYISTDVVGNQCTVMFTFPYGDISMNFLFRAMEGKREMPDIEMGISEIASRIPEMLQN